MMGDELQEEFCGIGPKRASDGSAALDLEVDEIRGEGADNHLDAAASRREFTLYHGSYKPTTVVSGVLCSARRCPYSRAGSTDQLYRTTGDRAVDPQQLPNGFQRAEFLKNHGMVDMVVHRHHLRSPLARLCSLLVKIPAYATPSGAEARMDA